MNVTTDLAACSLDELKTLLDGGTLTVYSVARPLTADQPVERSGALATFTFASPAFDAASDGLENPIFVANPVAASSVGTPGSPPGSRRRRFRSVASALLVGNWKRVMPTLFQAMPQKPPTVSKMR